MWNHFWKHWPKEGYHVDHWVAMLWHICSCINTFQHVEEDWFAEKFQKCGFRYGKYFYSCFTLSQGWLYLLIENYCCKCLLRLGLLLCILSNFHPSQSVYMVFWIPQHIGFVFSYIVLDLLQDFYSLTPQGSAIARSTVVESLFLITKILGTVWVNF